MFAERVGEDFDHDALLERIDDFNDKTGDLAQALAGDDEVIEDPAMDDLTDFARDMGLQTHFAPAPPPAGARVASSPALGSALGAAEHEEPPVLPEAAPPGRQRVKFKF